MRMWHTNRIEKRLRNEEFKMDYKLTLKHYGIKGQRHGVRRFQNEDGSLTPAGRDRYSTGRKIQNVAHGVSDDLEIMGAVGGVEVAEAKLSVNDKKRDVVDKALTKKENLLGQSKLRSAKRKIENKIAHIGDMANVGKAYLKLGSALAKKQLHVLKNTPLITSERTISTAGVSETNYYDKRTGKKIK